MRERLLKSVSSQYGSQIRFIFHSCLFLEGEIILFLVLTIWEHDTSLILWVIEIIPILHLPDFLLDGTNLLQLRKLQMILPELQYLLQLSLKGIYLSLKFIKFRLRFFEEVSIKSLIQTSCSFPPISSLMPYSSV